jgi:hypothetical protein
MNYIFILGANPPKVTLTTPTSFDTPYTYLLIVPYPLTLQNETNQTIDVTVDRTSSITVQIRDGNTSDPRPCIFKGTTYTCPFSYTSTNRNRLQLTYVYLKS